MTNQREETQKPTDAPDAAHDPQKPIKDLDIDKEEAGKVKGGRSSDPCEGGE